MNQTKGENRLPLVIYIFTISAFALGLAEFVPIGITEQIAEGIQVDVKDVGLIIAGYALGATFSAPIITAMTNGWSRKKTMLMTMLVFSAGSLGAAISYSLGWMVGARFVAGLGHGIFLAVASSTAARLAGSKKAGTAVAIVFGGFTIAMAIGVPLSTYLSNTVEWHWVMSIIGFFGVIGLLGLFFGMKNPLPAPADFKLDLKSEFKNIVHPKLLSGIVVTIFAYAGSFTVYTYITSLLVNETHLSISTITLYILLYGIFAAVGNIFGGKLTDKMGIEKANIFIISGIGLMTLGMTLFAESSVGMAILVSLLGFFTFASVPALQARLIAIANKHIPNGDNVAAGLNISGFNFAIAVGSLIGGFTIQYFGIIYTGLIGALLSGVGLTVLLFQIQISHKRESQLQSQTNQ